MTTTTAVSSYEPTGQAWTTGSRESDNHNTNPFFVVWAESGASSTENFEGLMLLRFLETASGSLYPQNPEVATIYEQSNELLYRIKTSLGLSITDLGRLLSVSRPTIYSWLNGKSEPMGESYHQLLKLREKADQVEASGLAELSKWIRRPVGVHGDSLMDRLLEGRDITDLLSRIQSWQDHDDVMRRRPKSNATALADPHETASDYSVPAHSEDL